MVERSVLPNIGTYSNPARTIDYWVLYLNAQSLLRADSAPNS